jgi:glycosyltransferase involved in cell wall biosynthesis
MLEAMSCETPLICSSTSSVLEVIKPQQNGVLVDFFKPSELAEKISIMLDNPKAYRDLQKNARKTIVNNYELRDCTRKKLNWLAQLAQLNELNP